MSSGCIVRLLLLLLDRLKGAGILFSKAESALVHFVKRMVIVAG